MTNPPGDPWEPRDRPNEPMPPPPYAEVQQERPQAVETAFKLWLINVALGLVSAVVALTMMDQLIDEAARQQNIRVTAEADAIVQTAVVVGIVFGLVLVAIWLAVAFQMRKGRNWARIVLAVLGGIGVIMSVIGMGDAFSMPGVAGFTLGILEIASTLLVIGAIYFMFRPESNAYFSSRR